MASPAARRSPDTSVTSEAWIVRAVVTLSPVSRTLAAAVGHEGAPVETQVVCVDRRRQWSRWGNVRHSAAIGTTLHSLGAPVRAVRRPRGPGGAG
jgi:hypothetical protein